MACQQGEIKGFRESEFCDDFFANILKKIDYSATLNSWKPINIKDGDGTLNSVVKYESNFGNDVVTGFRGFRLTYTIQDKSEKCITPAQAIDNSLSVGNSEEFMGTTQTGLQNNSIQIVPDKRNSSQQVVKDIVLKFKPTGLQRSVAVYEMVASRSAKLGQIWLPKLRETGDIHIEYKDMAVATTTNATWKYIQPQIFYCHMDDERKIYYFAMESYIQRGFENLEKSSDHEIECWTEELILEVFKEIAHFHSIYYDRTETLEVLLSKALAADGVWQKEKFMGFKDIILEMLECNIQTYDKILDKESIRILYCILKNLDQVCDVIDSCPQTIIHNDFSVRNICIRPKPAEGYSRVCIYDWERMILFPPQHDIVEFLAFALPTKQSNDINVWNKFITAYHEYFTSFIKSRNGHNSERVLQSIERENFQKVFDACVMEYCIWHLSLYCIQGYSVDLPFLPRVLKAVTNYLKLVAVKYDFLL